MKGVFENWLGKRLGKIKDVFEGEWRGLLKLDWEWKKTVGLEKD